MPTHQLMKQLPQNHPSYDYASAQYSYHVQNESSIPGTSQQLPQDLPHSSTYTTSDSQNPNNSTFDYQYQQYTTYMQPTEAAPPPPPPPPIEQTASSSISTDASQIDINYEYPKEQLRQIAATKLPASDVQEILDMVKKKPKTTYKRDKIECNICGSVFTHINSLRNHMLIHSGQKPFKCEYCGKAFARRTVLNIHRRLHTGVRPYKCTICGSGHVTKEAMLRHMGKEHESETNIKKVKVAYICSVCNKSRCSKYSLASHMKTHVRDKEPKKKRGPKSDKVKRENDKIVGNPKYVCGTCGDPFANKWDWSKHSATHEANKSFECDICSRIFEKKFQLLYHLQTHEGGVELVKAKMQTGIKEVIKMPKKESPDQVEKEGNSEFGKGKENAKDKGNPVKEVTSQRRTRRSVRGQKKSAEAKVKKENVAESADEDDSEAVTEAETVTEAVIEAEAVIIEDDGKTKKSITMKPTKKIYRRENLKIMRASRKIECHICGAVFTHACSLKSHMLVHSGERPHTCDLCDKSFARKNVLNVHRRLHTGEKPYKCPLCSSTAVTKDALMRHMSKDHDDERELDKLKYTCGICQKGMASKYSLQTHMKLHEEKGTIKPDAKYKCNTCNISFDSKWDYTSHMGNHDTVRNFQCDICQVTFEKKFKLLFHMQTHKIEEISCKKCGQSFTIRENLITHIKTHIDPKNMDFQCPQCDAGVYDTRDLKLHMIETHDISIGDINACDLCGLNYANANEYYRHVNEKHDTISKSCHECDKYFDSRKQFDKHMLTHYM